MQQPRLQKAISRERWPSAIWSLVEHPNLVVYKNGPSWMISTMGLTEENTPQALRVLDRLDAQFFATRQHALQALDAALILESD